MRQLCAVREGQTWRVRDSSESGVPAPSSPTPLDEYGRPLLPLSAAAADKQFAGPGERRPTFDAVAEEFSAALVPVMAHATRQDPKF